MTSEYFQIDNMPEIRGLRFRGYRGLEDVPHFHSISRKEAEFMNFDLYETLDDFIVHYKHLTNCDPSKDILVTELDGNVIGFSRVWWARKVRSGYTYRLFATLDPDFYGRGILDAMLDWCEKRGNMMSRQHPDSETKEFETWSMSNEDHWISLLGSRGFSKVRYGYIMTRPITGELPTMPLPPGLEVRPAVPEHYRKVWEADVEAAKDGWEMTEISEERYLHWLERGEFQPEKWQVAWDVVTNTVAGAVQNFISEEENRVYDRLRGYTENIHVARQYRGKGVAKSLIASSFRLLKGLGMEEACLGVDAENPTGALNLYRAMGFEVDKKFYTFRKGLQPVRQYG